MDFPPNFCRICKKELTQKDYEETSGAEHYWELLKKEDQNDFHQFDPIERNNEPE